MILEEYISLLSRMSEVPLTCFEADRTIRRQYNCEFQKKDLPECFLALMETVMDKLNTRVFRCELLTDTLPIAVGGVPGLAGWGSGGV